MGVVEDVGIEVAFKEEQGPVDEIEFVWMPCGLTQERPPQAQHRAQEQGSPRDDPEPIGHDKPD